MIMKFVATFWVVVLIIGISNAQDIQPEALSIWHAWHDQDVDFLNGLGDIYTSEKGVPIEFTEFQTEAQLVEAAQKALSAGNAPDLILANHVSGTVLLNSDVVGAYCIDGSGACGVCFKENPPEWCLYAQGRDFGHGQIQEFPLSTDYCLPGGCKECEAKIPAPWCPIADILPELGLRLDVLQASVMVPYKLPTATGPQPFPTGIPVWWEYLDIYAKSDLFDMHGVTIPTSVDELRSFINDTGFVSYDVSRFDFSDLPQDPVPTVVQDIVPFELPQDPEPDEQALIFVASSDQLSLLEENNGTLLSLTIEGYKPSILVHNVYVTTQSANPESALDFAYFLADEEAQEMLFESTGHLPANGEVIAEIMENADIAETMSAGFKGHLAYPFGVGE